MTTTETERNINVLDFEDDPIFSDPHGHYYDSSDAYIDREDNYLLANVYAERTRGSTKRAKSTGSSLIWTPRRLLKWGAVLLGVGFLSKILLLLSFLIIQVVT